MRARATRRRRLRVAAQIDAPDDPTPILVKRLWAHPAIHCTCATACCTSMARRSLRAGIRDNARQPDHPMPLRLAAALCAHRIAIRGRTTEPTLEQLGPIVVPPEHYFMMGDNRYDSKDSPLLGFVPAKFARSAALRVLLL